MESNKEFTMTRIINAPLDMVFNAWIDPVQMGKWWGPKGITNPVCELDARPGGAIRIDMHTSDGFINKMTGTFHEIVPGERIVFTNKAFEDEQGNPQMEALNMIMFEAQGDKTKLTVHVTFRQISAELWEASKDNMHLGWGSSFDRLENLLQGLSVE